ncbi:hypothetical protein DKX38_002290 [Salix brachista]|uniref:Uncharacterized protein n=1 Tax=Salix brachista TaxID=2182728 RepID=A0A5N5NN80_9ROSI|nr:hypothetical protein DKX38_002290 [Salix brachista]
MQAGAKGRSGEVWLRILEKDGILGLHQAILSRTRKSHLLPIENVCCGALAGAISASLTTPLDVVKTSGVSATVKQILKEEGWVGFRRGMGPRVIHRACFSALGYFEFETARLTILHHYLEHKELRELDVAPTRFGGCELGIEYHCCWLRSNTKRARILLRLGELPESL